MADRTNWSEDGLIGVRKDGQDCVTERMSPAKITVTRFPWVRPMSVHRSRVLLPYGHSALDAGNSPVLLPGATTPGRCAVGPSLTRCRFSARHSSCILLTSMPQ